MMQVKGIKYALFLLLIVWMGSNFSCGVSKCKYNYVSKKELNLNVPFRLGWIGSVGKSNRFFNADAVTMKQIAFFNYNSGEPYQISSIKNAVNFLENRISHVSATSEDSIWILGKWIPKLVLTNAHDSIVTVIDLTEASNFEGSDYRFYDPVWYKDKIFFQCKYESNFFRRDSYPTLEQTLEKQLNSYRLMAFDLKTGEFHFFLKRYSEYYMPVGYTGQDRLQITAAGDKLILTNGNDDSFGIFDMENMKLVKRIRFELPMTELTFDSRIAKIGESAKNNENTLENGEWTNISRGNYDYVSKVYIPYIGFKLKNKNYFYYNMYDSTFNIIGHLCIDGTDYIDKDIFILNGVYYYYTTALWDQKTIVLLKRD